MCNQSESVEGKIGKFEQKSAKNGRWGGEKKMKAGLKEKVQGERKIFDGGIRKSSFGRKLWFTFEESRSLETSVFLMTERQNIRKNFSLEIKRFVS